MTLYAHLASQARTSLHLWSDKLVVWFVVLATAASAAATLFERAHAAVASGLLDVPWELLMLVPLLAAGLALGSSRRRARRPLGNRRVGASRSHAARSVRPRSERQR
jgi:hypothetical protein